MESDSWRERLKVALIAEMSFEILLQSFQIRFLFDFDH